MNSPTTPRPGEPDLHLSVFLHGARLDFAACRTAALRFIQEWHARQRSPVTVFPGSTEGLTRLPCERLYLEP
ncbi:hypothetical protein [Nocardia donostiensis]|uniref:Uncharacterized protein n=1 Tax=Nocardia donostiensis TaxID=1538463 RepID=A0A1V2TM58_9NOCA|nr:hypothetical protein [Nocardia donostiensis]ONM50604.1 hypothetical protein B0T46_01515 [Nocardia donostiensis]OQS20752.1 hypothetical protein B0T44_08950 [Nocardia donostiensis]